MNVYLVTPLGSKLILGQFVVIDSALEHAKKKTDEYEWTVVTCIEDYQKKTVRAFSRQRKIFWARTCRTCDGVEKLPRCETCFGYGAVYMP
jgi:hypothetical protein